MQARRKLIFPKDPSAEFYFELKERIAPLLAVNMRNVTRMSWLKLFLFPLLFAGVYFLLLENGRQLGWFYLCYALLGICTFLVVINIVHDASHHALFKNPRLNRLAACLLDCLGGNSYLWQRRHVHYHHSFTNVPGWDADLETKKLFRLSKADKLRKGHRYQHIYMPFVYCLFTLHWFVVRDFRDFFDPRSIVRRMTRIPAFRYTELIFFKAVYFFYMLVIPVLAWSHHWYHYVLAFLLLHVVASLLAVMVILPNHLAEQAVFRFPGEGLKMKESWALHQLTTTNDLSMESPAWHFMTGGINYHIAHHLFPGINHNYLPAITREIKRITKEKNLPYHTYSLGYALRSHFRLLKKTGRTVNIFDE